jgi:hypothetical protein
MAKGDEMSLTHQFSRMAGLALAAVVIFTTIIMTAQTVISNETLVTTTFVVNKTDAAAKCGQPSCTAKTPILKSIPVTCPAAIGQTCTVHIAFDAKVSLGSICTMCEGPAGVTAYQFFVDGVPPTIGPTDVHGNYLFADNVFTDGKVQEGRSNRQSYPASVISAVTNTSSQSHSIDVNLVCRGNGFGGCAVVAHGSTMRVDVFEP